MIWEYLAGDLSVLLERPQSATDAPADDLAWLRHQVDDGTAADLDAELAHALAAADRLCWDSLARRHRRVHAAGASLRGLALVRCLRRPINDG